MGNNYSLVIPGFGGQGNDLRLVFGPEAAREVVRDIQKILTAASVQAQAATNSKAPNAGETESKGSKTLS